MNTQPSATILSKEAEAFHLVFIEMDRQIELWGNQHTNSLDRWMSILGEEFGEVCKAINEKEPNERIREEAVQVAAVAMQIVKKLL